MDGTGCVIVLVLLLFIILAWHVITTKTLERARQDYLRALHELKSNPTSANLRQETLRLGRVYSNLTRSNRGVSLFDEVALMNDINAACAGAVAPQPQPNIPPPQQHSMEVRLARLADLRAKGLIDEREYSTRREQILNEI